MKKTELPIYNINEDEIKKLNDNDNKKEFALKKLQKNKNKIISQIKKIYFSLFNKKNAQIRYLFFILVIVSSLEFFFSNLTDIFILRFSVAIIFFVPLVIITIEYETFFKVCSLFEYNSLVLIKVLVLFSLKFSFIDILIFNLFQNGIYSYFVKKLYIFNEYLGNEVKDRKRLRVNIFISNFKVLLFGYFSNTVYLLYLFYKDKLSFYLFNELIPHYNIIYYEIFLILSSRKLFKFLFKYYNSKLLLNQIPKPKLILFFLIFLQLIIIYFLSNNLVIFFYVCIIIIIFWILYETIGNFIYICLLLIYIFKYIGIYYIEENYDNNFQNIFYYNFFFVNISTCLSICFIISIFYMEKDNLSKTYIKIYERIFQLKILFDIWLIINFIYRLYKNTPQTYYDNFYNTYKLLFLCFILNYIIVYIIISFKLSIYVTEKDINWYFDDLGPYIKKDRLNTPILYGNYTPYVELKFYQRIKKIFSNFNENMKKNERNRKSLKKILNFVNYTILCFLCIIINNSSIFYGIYFFLLQFMHNHFNKYGKKIYDIFILVKFQFDDEDEKRSLSKKMQQKKLNEIRKGKYKLIYILIYPYLAILWKIFFSKMYIIIYEKILIKIQFLLLGKLEPVENIIYQFIIKNEINDNFSFFNFIILILFILPNSLCVIITHINEMKPSFFFQNYLITSLIGIFINTHPLILITGLVNIFIMINIFAADEETYNTLFFWFDLLGINSSNISE